MRLCLFVPSIITISISLIRSVTVSAEAYTGLVAVGMALITIVPKVAVPAPATLKQRRIGGMDTRVGPSDTVVITVTAPATAGGLAALVTGSTVFHIPPRRLAVILPPRKQRVIHRHPYFLFVAINAKARGLVALLTVSLFAGCFQTVREPIVQVVDVPLEVISEMALQAACFATMARRTPRPLRHRSFTVLVPPAFAVDIGQREALAVTELTGIVGDAAIMTIHTQRLAGPENIIDRFTLIHTFVTTKAGHIASEVQLVIEFKFIGFDVAGRFFRIMMAHIAGFIVLDVMTVAAGAHVGQVVIGAEGAALYLRVADIAGCFRFADMEGVGENDIT